MANIIPERTINYRVFIGDEQRVAAGTATVDLPSVTLMADTVSGAGIAGEYESPTIGHTQSMTTTINWRTPTPELISLIQPGGLKLTFRASLQQYDAGTGRSSSVQLRIVMIVMSKDTPLGSLAPGAASDSSTELEVVYLKIFHDKIERLEIDKLNFKFVVNGIDYLARVREDLGM